MAEEEYNPWDCIIADVDTATQFLPQVRYNAKFLDFLCHQMEKVAGIKLQELPAKNTPLYESMIVLRDEIKGGVKLVKKHAQRFNIQTFYRVEQVETLVREMCATFALCLEDLGWEAVSTIQTSVNQSMIDGDRRHLQWYLTCILEGETQMGTKLQDHEQQELDMLIKEYQQRFHFLNMRISDDKIQYGDDCIGEGGNGEVVRAQWEGTTVAVKKPKMKSHELSIESRAEFFSEVELQMQMSSPHVVRVFGATNSNCIVMELAYLDLGKFWQRNRCLSWLTKIGLMLSASLGLEHLHDAGVVHRDVKPGNFLVFNNPSCEIEYAVKITDFGLSLMKQEIRTKTMRTLGTTLFMAPEIHHGEAHQFSSDVFSFGVVMYELAAESVPYRNHQTDFRLAKWKHKGRDPCCIQDDCPLELLYLMKGCIAPDGSERPSIGKVSLRLREIYAKVSKTIQHRGIGV